MTLKLRTRKLIQHLAILTSILIGSTVLVFLVIGSVWSRWDYRALDWFYKKAILQQFGPEVSDQIVYITISDETYSTIGKNYLDRADLAHLNNILAELEPQSVAYDMIFPRPSNTESDNQFTQSLENLGLVFLPIGFHLSEKPEPFQWESSPSYKRLRNEYLKNPEEHGVPKPTYATRPFMHLEPFAMNAYKSGHINMLEDRDGIFRHNSIVLRIDSKYFPSLSLSMFLDYMRVPFEKVIIRWGKEVIIPAIKGSFLEKDVRVPIDEFGKVFVPYPRLWNEDFKQMGMHTLFKHFEDPNIRGNLEDIFQANFVFVGEVSQQATDIGNTPLEEDVPLVAVHASLLNAYLNNTFYEEWSFWETIGVLVSIGVLLGFSIWFRSSWWPLGIGAAILIALLSTTWYEMIHFSLFPIVTILSTGTVFFLLLMLGVHLEVSKEREFIQNAFFKYVPEKVVKHLIDHPDLLQLGGQERELSVLFIDLANFTTISEQHDPKKLVQFLNRYLTDMTEIVFEEEGIIDKYLGDAIMAVFGAPLTIPDHADRAVRAGLKMLKKARDSEESWNAMGFPQLHCRIGINTGKMIIGNMGSEKSFDYTVIGDAVNLASRLEGTNKLYGTQLIVSEATYSRLTPNLFSTRALDVVKVKGKKKSVKIFEVYGQNGEGLDAKDLEYFTTYQNAFESFLDRKFPAAMDQLCNALALRPDDLASQEIVDRIVNLNPEKLPKDWDGSVSLRVK